MNDHRNARNISCRVLRTVRKCAGVRCSCLRGTRVRAAYKPASEHSEHLRTVIRTESYWTLTFPADFVARMRRNGVLQAGAELEADAAEEALSVR